MIKNGKRKELHDQVEKIEDILTKQIEKYLEDYTQESLGAEIGKSGAWVSQALNPLNETSFYIKQLPVLGELLGPELLMKLAENMGFFMVPVPNVPKGKREFREISKVIKEFSDMTQETAKGFEDGVLMKDERDRIVKEIDEAVIAMLSFKRAVRED